MAAKRDAVEDVVVAKLACAVQLCVHVKKNAKTSESPLFAKHLFIHYMNITCRRSIHFAQTFMQQTSESVVTRKSKKKIN